MANASAVPVSGPQLDNRRVLAALIDLAVVLGGALLVGFAAGASGFSEVPASLDAVLVGWALYYYFACESSESGQTLGKRAMNIRVVRADGAPAGMREIGVRTILRVIDGMFFYLVGLIVMLATGQRRGRLGDLAAGTKVVSADAPARAQAAVAVAAEPEAPRVPIAESGPAFAEPAEAEAEADAETVDMESPALKELAVDVEATAGSAADEPEAAESAPDLKPVPDPEPAEDDPADDELTPAAEADEAPVVEVEAEPQVEEPEAEVAAPEPEPEVVAAEAEVEHAAEAAEVDESDEPEDDPLAGAADDELDEAEIAAAVEAELDGEQPARKPRARASKR